MAVYLSSTMNANNLPASAMKRRGNKVSSVIQVPPRLLTKRHSFLLSFFSYFSSHSLRSL
ncbi:hypothetical protein E2C01_079421 [Portunus trituberculatus]|uniref:Uncharacterized protein n=1 Tax=Portunus trituberculatus TaxID=210409 RepID=A0A5B7ISQ3_PORTR|nr:hypothetical protein [Portunus trituberculatus]